ncbi:MAG: hypothetical protein AAFY25_12590, partial [Pseudomonadota bacterium]
METDGLHGLGLRLLLQLGECGHEEGIVPVSVSNFFKKICANVGGAFFEKMRSKSFEDFVGSRFQKKLWGSMSTLSRNCDEPRTGAIQR